MMNNKKPEVWLRGELPGISTLLQPAAHALLQSKEEVFKYTEGFPEFLLWKRPAGRASVGFHLQHITGVLDRMLTYAEEQQLSEKQFEGIARIIHCPFCIWYLPPHPTFHSKK